MASDKSYLAYLLEQLSGLEGVSHRAMMGEYILYVQGKVIGGIYDNRLLVKPTPSARQLMPDAPEEFPYEGAKAMLLVEEVDNADFMRKLFTAMAEELPQPKNRRN